MSLEECKQWAEAKGGECLFTEFVLHRTEMRWRCAQQHIWTATWGNIKRHSWCPSCATCGSSVGETLSRAALQHLFDGYRFDKERPAWLQGEHGRALELDGVNHELKIAFEYDGMQHSKVVRFGDQTQEEALHRFEQTQVNDRLKDALLAEKDYHLIRIDYAVAHLHIYDHIKSECVRRGLEMAPSPIPFDTLTIETGKHGFLGKWKEYATSMGGQLHDNAYSQRQNG